MYQVTNRIMQLYSFLKDEQSKMVFWARLICDIDPSIENINSLQKLADDYGCMPALAEIHRKELNNLLNQGNALYLYGTSNMGKFIGRLLSGAGVEFTGFCGRGFQKYPAGILGKPVISPKQLFEQGTSSYVIISASDNNGSFSAILRTLRENGFPESHILHYFDETMMQWKDSSKMYFEFMNHFPEGTAFVDGGSYDGKNSVDFAEFVSGKYTEIYAFEPDPLNYEKCKRTFEQHKTERVKLFQAGLSDQDSKATFAVLRNSSSHLQTSGNSESLSTVTVAKLDTIMDNVKVGMIKLDIEGAEYGALTGAKTILKRDRPLLAICVYHIQGDMLSIMDYLNKTEPDYRFWLRQYGIAPTDTVLYAAVES